MVQINTIKSVKRKGCELKMECNLLEPTKANIIFWKNSKDMMVKRVQELTRDLVLQKAKAKKLYDKWFADKEENKTFPEYIEEWL